MTRSVEIPEAAYEEATDAIAAMLGSWPASASLPHHPDLSPRDVLRAIAITALEAAALPYLAPAGDGGLRAAMEKLCDRYERIAEELSIRGGVKATYDIPGSEIRHLLAAHPAAPAVPQPADERPLREAMEKLAGDMAYDSSDGGAKIRAVLDAHPAVPQPVDREALERLAERWAAMDTPALSLPSNQDWAQGVDLGYGNAAAELLALLAGEQEQVEKCDAQRPGASMNCVRNSGHEGQHGYGGIFWS